MRQSSLRKFIFSISAVNVLLLTAVFVSIKFSANIIGFQLISILIFAVTIAVLLLSAKQRKPENVFSATLFAVCIPSDIFRYLAVLFAALIVLLFLKRNKDSIPTLQKTWKIFIILLLYIFLIYFAFSFYYDDYWSLPLYLVTFLSYPLFAFSFFGSYITNVEIYKIIRFFITFLFAHVLLVAVFPLLSLNYYQYSSALSSITYFLWMLGINLAKVQGFTGDVHYGIFNTSIDVGFVSAILLVFSLCYYFLCKKRSYFLIAIIAMWVYTLSDTKLTYAVTFFGILISLWQLRNSVKIAFIRYVPYLFTLVIALFVIFSFSSIVDFFKGMTATYTKNVSNPKYLLYQRCIQENINNPLSFFVGRGPGTFGSRVSNARASKVLVKNEIKLPDFVPTLTTPEYEEIMYGLYTEDFLRQSKSGALMNPFASIIGIVMELGLIGTLLLGVFFYKTITIANKMINMQNVEMHWKAFAVTVNFCILYFLYASFFDQYFENPVCATIFWAFIALLFVQYRYLSNFKKSTVENSSDHTISK